MTPSRPGGDDFGRVPTLSSQASGHGPTTDESGASGRASLSPVGGGDASHRRGEVGETDKPLGWRGWLSHEATAAANSFSARSKQKPADNPGEREQEQDTESSPCDWEVVGAHSFVSENALSKRRLRSAHGEVAESKGGGGRLRSGFHLGEAAMAYSPGPASVGRFKP